MRSTFLAPFTTLLCVVAFAAKAQNSEMEVPTDRNPSWALKVS